MIVYNKAQQLMIDDGCPDHLIRTPERDQAAKDYWISNPPKSKPVFLDPRLEASHQLRLQQRQAEAERRKEQERQKKSVNKKVQKVDPTGLRWDSINARWIPDVNINVNTQESEMAIAGVTLYSSRGAARKGAKRAGLMSFTVVQDGDKFKFVTAEQLMEASAQQMAIDKGSAESAPAVSVQSESAGTENADMAKKKAKTNGAGPSKVQQVISLCERKAGCTLADIADRLSVSAAAAASLIADVRRVRKSLKRERLESGASAYYL